MSQNIEITLSMICAVPTASRPQRGIAHSTAKRNQRIAASASPKCSKISVTSSIQWTASSSLRSSLSDAEVFGLEEAGCPSTTSQACKAAIYCFWGILMCARSYAARCVACDCSLSRTRRVCKRLDTVCSVEPKSPLRCASVIGGIVWSL